MGVIANCLELKKNTCKDCGKFRRVNHEELCFWCWDRTVDKRVKTCC